MIGKFAIVSGEPISPDRVDDVVGTHPQFEEEREDGTLLVKYYGEDYYWAWIPGEADWYEVEPVL